MTNIERIKAEIEKYEHELASLRNIKAGLDAYLHTRIHLAEQKIMECRYALDHLEEK